MMFEQLDDPTPPEFGARHRAGVRTVVRARRRRKLAVGGVATAVVIGLSGLSARMALRVDQIRRVDVAGVDDSVDVHKPITLLLVGTDGEEATAEASRPSRADSAILVRVDPVAGTVRMLSLPRDLDVATDGESPLRLSEAYAQGGVDGLLRHVEGLGVKVDHLAVVDFGGFTGLVDAIGGIDVSTRTSLRDTHSGLAIDGAGCHRLDGAQALALVRARYLEHLDGRHWVADPSGDFGRIDRQQALLRAVLVDLASATPGPIAVDRLVGWASDYLTVDAALGNAELLELARAVAAIDPERVESSILPTVALAKDGVAMLRPVDTGTAFEWFSEGHVTVRTTSTTVEGATGNSVVPATPGVVLDDLISPC